MEIKRIGCAIVLACVGLALPASAQTQNPASQGKWQPPPPPKSWNAPEHHGYMDGIEAAWLDLADHLPPRASRHEGYRHPPNVPVNRDYWYQLGFRRGYQAVYRHEQGSHPQSRNAARR